MDGGILINKEFLKASTGAPRAIQASKKLLDLMDTATGFEISDRTFINVFFLEMRIRNATDADFEWLVKEEIVSESERTYWDESAEKFAVYDAEDAE